MEEHKNIDRLFQEKFKDFEVFPEPVVWKNIEKHMTKKKKRMIIPLWLRLGVAAAILIGAFLTGIGMFNEDTQDPTKSTIEISNKNSEPAEGDAVITKNDSEIEKEGSQEESNAEDSNVKEIIRPSKENITETNVLKKPSTAGSQQEKLIIDDLKAAEAMSIAAEEVVQTGEITFESTNPVLNKALISVENGEKSIQDIVALQENEKQEDLKELDLSKWSIGSNVAPVYFNSIGNGSPIDASLANNSKESNAGLSYGIKINYKISNKLTIQSGLNTVELGYATKNAAALLSSSLTDNSGTNIDSNLDGVAVEVFSTQVQNSETFSQRSLFDNSGEIDQTLNYIEWPIEAKFAMIQKRFGVNLVGGFSTYVLYQNNVSLTSFGKTTSLGEASNINDVNFSGNFGLDLNYNVSKKIYLNASPMLKYQFNTFSGDTGGFKPYFLGIYAGLNFRF